MDFVHYYDKLLSRINQVIRTFDTGISEGSVQEISLEEPGSSVPKEIFADIISRIRVKISSQR